MSFDGAGRPSARPRPPRRCPAGGAEPNGNIPRDDTRDDPAPTMLFRIPLARVAGLGRPTLPAS